jgi:hypothetical protein
MTTDEIERRLNVWQALSDLFLDTEIDSATYKYIAKAVVESQYRPEEIKHILWQEVFPVLESNLRSVAGVWDGYPRDWLLQHLSIATHTFPLSASPEIAEGNSFLLG